MVLEPPAPAPAEPPLSVAALVTSIRETLYCLPDHRKGGNNQRYPIGDAVQQHGADARVLIALDGTEYHCSTRTLANGQSQYYQVAVTPVIVAPGQETVFPLAPEFVRPQDAQIKQHCELNAATRWLRQWGARIAPWRTTLLGDDLYCHQPFCEQGLEHGCAFMFVSLPPSHRLLYEWVAGFERTGEVPTLVKTRWTGTQRLTDTYRWINERPLRDREDALRACEKFGRRSEGVSGRSRQGAVRENGAILVD